MDPKEPSEPAKCISEYTEAKERFEKFSKHYSQDETVTYLDELFSKLCTGEFHLEAGTNASQFYEIIYHSDFLQIKNEFLEVIYSELCRVFFFSDLFGDILKNMEQLDYIPHVKIFLVQALLKLLQVVPQYENDYLVLKYSSNKIWYNIGSTKVPHLKIHPSAYKVMVSNDKFLLTHLNFICRQLEVQNLRLDGCNLNDRDVCNLFKDLKLNSLGLSKCGTSVNVLFQEKLLDLENLLDLDVSENPIFNSTLEIIRNIPLKNLNVKNSIRTVGVFIDSIWFHENFFRSTNCQTKGQACEGNINLLWADGVLKDTIEILNINNDLSQVNLVNISKLNLKKLYIQDPKYIGMPNVNFSIHFPNTLRSLTLEYENLAFDEFANLTLLPLEELNIHYKSSKENEDFSALIDTSLTNTLEKLSVYLHEPCEDFVLFIATFKLVYFKCDGEIENESLDRFICQYTLQRKFLKSLFINGVMLDLTPALLDGISKLKLVEFGIGLPETVTEYHKVLALENLQETVETLWLYEKECEIEELKQIALFRKVKELAFTFTAGISATHLHEIANMKTVKLFKVEAIVKGILDLNGAQSLCAIPIDKLFVFDDYGKSISDEAFKYLSNSENSTNFCQNAVFLNMRGSLKPNMAKILGCVNWETIIFDPCAAEESTLKLFFQNGNFIHTLQYLKFIDLDVDWEGIGKLLISEMIVETYNLPEKAFKALTCGPISKFLRYVLLEDKNINWNLLLQTNLSEVDTY